MPGYKKLVSFAGCNVHDGRGTKEAENVVGGDEKVKKREFLQKVAGQANGAILPVTNQIVKMIFKTAISR